MEDLAGHARTTSPPASDLTPDIGVTSTGVYDPSTNTVYEMGLVHETSWEWHLFGLNVGTGAITFKQRIVGSPTNDSHLSFSALPEGQRSGLLLMNGWVYATFGSHCDNGSYNGYVAGVNTATNATTLWADESGVSQREGRHLAERRRGHVRRARADLRHLRQRHLPAEGPGQQSARPARRVGDPAVAAGPTGSLKPQDFFSPSNAPSLDSSDSDFGSGGPTGAPFGTSTYPDVMMQAGKGGAIYLLNRDNLGGRSSSDSGALAAISPIAKQWNSPAFFADTPTLTTGNAAGANDYMIFVGRSDFMREYKAGVSSSGKPTLSDVNNSTFTLGYSSGAPAITSNGTDPTTGLIWEEHHSDSHRDRRLPRRVGTAGRAALGRRDEAERDLGRADRDGLQVHQGRHEQRHGLPGHQGRQRLRVRHHQRRRAQEQRVRAVRRHRGRLGGHQARLAHRDQDGDRDRRLGERGQHSGARSPWARSR